MDVGAVGSRFTWRGPLYNGHMRIFERLDRALCNDEWRLMFPNAVVKVLPRIQFSDHHPIMVHLGGIQQIFGNRKFRFERAWTLHSTYKDVVHQAWDDQNPIPLKVKNMEEKLTHWRVHTFGSIRKQKIELMARIGGIQRRQHEGTSNNFLNKLEKTLQAQLDIALTQEEMVWFQKSRAQWIKDGDRNTRYYHLKTLNRRRKNKISMLRNEEGIWVEDEGQLKFMVNDFYHKLFEDPSNINIWHQTLHTYPPLSDAEKEELKKDIQNIEVKESLFSMGAWKAPGPDGFPAGFYQGEWRKMQDNLCLFIRDTWKNPSEVEAVNFTYICLISKGNKPEFVNQFRPISLCNVTYKIMTKIVVNRLKNIITKVISPSQTGFVPRRNISENIVVAQEMLHSMAKMRSNIGYFAIKVDLAKAYDRLRWSFIYNILQEIGI
jgi:hypothetical protein